TGRGQKSACARAAAQRERNSRLVPRARRPLRSPAGVCSDATIRASNKDGTRMLSDEIRLRLGQLHRPAVSHSPADRPLWMPAFFSMPEAPDRQPFGDELLAQAEE